MLRLSLTLVSVQRSNRCLNLKREKRRIPRAAANAGRQRRWNCAHTRFVTCDRRAGQPEPTTWFSSTGVKMGSPRAPEPSTYTKSSSRSSRRTRPVDW